MANFSQPLPEINVTVDVVIFTVRAGVLNVLLIRRAGDPYAGQLALPGGYLQVGELALESAKRVLLSKAGVRDVFMEQLYTFDGVARDPRGRHLSMVYFALVPEAELVIEDTPDLQQPELLPVNSLPKLAFDHLGMIDYAVTRLRSKLEYTNVVYSLLPAKFTMTELQQTYEAILDRPLDKRNFQKKYASLDLIEATDEYTSGGKHRPARLFKFKSSQPAELKKFF